MPATQPPRLPMAVFGSAVVNGSPVPIGGTVDARAPGVRWGIATNPYEVTEAGRFGNKLAWLPRLDVQGEIEIDTPISFYVDGVRADQTVPYRSGTKVEIALTASGAPEPFPSTGGWYLIDWTTESVIQADPPGSPSMAEDQLEEIVKSVYRFVAQGVSHWYRKGADTWPIAQALDLGYPRTVRFREGPFGVQAFRNGIVAVSYGVIL